MTEEEYLQLIKSDVDYPQPTYYSILYANVRYSKELSDFEKVLFSDILALTNAKGFCFATNNYFARAFDKSKVHISNSINNIRKAGFIDVKMVYRNNSKEVVARIITVKVEDIRITNIKKEAEEDFGADENFNTPIKENFNDNIINFKTTRGIAENFSQAKQNNDGVCSLEANASRTVPPQDNQIIRNDNQLDNLESQRESVVVEADNPAEGDEPTPTPVKLAGAPLPLQDFKNELMLIYGRLSGRMVSELKQIPNLKTQEKRDALKQAFKDRRYEYKGCLKFAEAEAMKSNSYKYRWFDFLDTLFITLKDGGPNIKREFTQEELAQIQQRKLDKELQAIAEREEKRKQEELDRAEAAKMGMSLEEYNDYMNEQAMQEVRNQMQSFLAQISLQPVNIPCKQEKPATSEPRSNEGYSTEEDMAKIKAEIEEREKNNLKSNQNMMRILKKGGLKALYDML